MARVFWGAAKRALIRSSRAQQGDQRQQQNIQIAREQKQQLEAQLVDGQLSFRQRDGRFRPLPADEAEVQPLIAGRATGIA